MWSDTIEVLNPYVATVESLKREHELEKENPGSNISSGD